MLASAVAVADPGAGSGASSAADAATGATASAGSGAGSDAGSDAEVIEVTGAAPVVTPPASHAISAAELHDLPGGGNDALRGLSSLPGVARIPFGLGGLALRGAAPHDTAVYFDGIQVPLLYHFGGLASFVPIDAIDRVQLTASGAGVAWGDGIGGVVLLDSKSITPTHWSAQGEVSLLHAGVLATGPSSGGGSWTVGVRRSYVDAVLAAAQVNLGLAPSYLDAQLRWESHDKHWELLAFASDDDLHLVHDPNDMSSEGGISTALIKSLDYNTGFVRIGARYHAGGVTVTPWLGFDDLDAIANHDDLDKGYTRLDLVYALRVEVDHRLLGGTLRTGFDGRATSYDYGISGTPPPYPGMPMPPNGLVAREATKMAGDAALFAEQDWRLAHGHLAIRPGVRLSYFGLADQGVVDPRLTVTEQVGDAVFEGQVGMYHESPLVTDLDPLFGDRTLPPPQSIQASASAEAPMFGLFEGKATAYVADQSNLPVDVISGATPISNNGSIQAGGLLAVARELIDDQFGSYSYREYVGAGQAWGLELMARRDLGRLTGWISYTYARAFRTGDPRRDATYYPYVLDQPHILTAVASMPLGGSWRVGGRFRLASGNPITPVAGVRFDPTKSAWIPMDGPILSERLPYFAQLDLRVDHVWHRPSGLWDLYLDVQNVTNRANAEGVTYNADYSQRYYTSGLPVFPSLGLAYRPGP